MYDLLTSKARTAARASLLAMLAACAYGCSDGETDPQAATETPVETTAAPVSFAFNSDGTAYLQDGWSTPEETFTWTVGETARLLIPAEALPAPGAPQTGWTFALESWAFLPNSRSNLRVEVTANGTAVGALEYALAEGGHEMTMRSLDLGDAWSPGEPLALTFEIDDPRSPSEMGVSPDDRRLGIAVSTITVRVAGQ